MKTLICIFSLLILSYQLRAQDNDYQKLITEREELIKEYEYLNAQNNNFWGKKSKKDLLLIIDNLKAIIKKDSEIINNVQADYVKRNADLTVKTEKLQTERQSNSRMISENMVEMKRELLNFQARDKQRLQTISDLKEQVSEVKSAKTEHDLITVITSIGALFLLLYVLKLRSKLAHTHKK